MPKLKTRKALKKRAKVTGTGRIKRAQGGKRHLMRKKNSKRRLALKKGAYVSKVEEKKIKEMLPYA